MQTVVGVFDTVDQAEKARESLLDAGFDPASVTLQSNTLARGESDPAPSAGSARHDGDSRDEGFMASISKFFNDLFGGGEHEHVGHYSEAVRRGSTVVAVTVSDQSRVEAARAALSAAGAVDIDKRSESWRQEGYSGFDASAKPYHPDETAAERSRYSYDSGGLRQPGVPLTPDRERVQGGTVLPVVREDIEVGKREVDMGTVRVFSRTETRPVEEAIQLREQHAEIERHSVDRPASEADLRAFEGGAIEIHETAERPVVSKTARVVEEVRVGTESTTHTETVSDRVRNTVVEVEKDTADLTSSLSNSINSGVDYRNHYQSNIAWMGGTYEDYEPAYQYGSTLRADPRYAHRAWDEVEADAQRDWLSRHPDGQSAWEKTKQAVRHGWESMTGRR